MTAEQMIRVWAAKKLGVSPLLVRSVTFDHEDGYGYSEYTWEPESNGANVMLTTGETRYISNYDGWEGVPDLLTEILEANA